MSKATHVAKILAYCKKHGSITVRDAYKLDINSPTKVISNMRLSGRYEVTDVEESRVNSNNERVRYKRYFIRAVDADGSL
jgi:hypothetical protein